MILFIISFIKITSCFSEYNQRNIILKSSEINLKVNFNIFSDNFIQRYIYSLILL